MSRAPDTTVADRTLTGNALAVEVTTALAVLAAGDGQGGGRSWLGRRRPNDPTAGPDTSSAGTGAGTTGDPHTAFAGTGGGTLPFAARQVRASWLVASSEPCGLTAGRPAATKVDN